PSIASENVETRYTEMIPTVAVASTAPATFSESTSQAASENPSVPPIRILPPNRRSGVNDSPAQRLPVSRSDPAIFTPPASIPSERIHFHASRNVNKGKRNDAAPNTWKEKSARYDPGYPMRLSGRAPDAVFQDGSWTWYETRLRSITKPAERIRK